MSKITTFLKRLIRRILMNAWWTALGAMLIPVGVIFMIEKPERAGIAMWIIIFGFVSVIAGLALTVREERKKEKRESNGKKGESIPNDSYSYSFSFRCRHA